MVLNMSGRTQGYLDLWLLYLEGWIFHGEDYSDTDLDTSGGENQEFDFKYFKFGIFVKTSR